MSSRPLVAVRDLSFSWDSASAPLIDGVTAHFPSGFSGVVGPNGAGKSTLLRLLVGELQPDSGQIEGVAQAVYCAQRTDDPPVTLKDFLDDWDPEAFELRGRLGVEVDYLERWRQLSHGERKRAQIACALWARPDLLAIDEPTNHIDRAARAMLLDALGRFGGVGLIVSHDREVLNSLCAQCLWLDPPRAELRPGGYTDGAEQRDGERTTAQRERRRAQVETRRLRAEVIQRRDNEEKAHRARSRGKVARGDHDAREKINRARVTDGNAGKQQRQLGGRMARAEARLQSARVEKDYETGIWLPGARSRRDLVVNVEPGSLPLGEERVLHWPALTIRPDQRIAITGPNGSGKSTLVEHVLKHVNVEPEHLVTLPQEIRAEAGRALLNDVRAMNSSELGTVMTAVSRLGSRPARLLESREPSPGEVRKLLLGLGIAREPHLIVMDEPTNHLDLPSIEALESAFAECPCALLVVSHDEPFLDALGVHRWRIEVAASGDSHLEIDDQAV